MLVVTWLGGLLRRRTGRMVGQSVGVALAVLLLAALGTFFTSSRATMTEQAVRTVPVDWQVQVSPGAPVDKVATAVARSAGVTASAPVGYADTSGLSSRSAGTVQTTGPGVVLGLPPDYATTFPGEIRPLVGARTGALLAQQTAANLGASVGSTITIGRPGQPKTTVTVDGIVDLPAADSLFQSIGVAPGSAPTAPPDNVVLLPDATWHRMFANAASGTSSTQIHVKLAHDLPADPGAAFGQVIGRAKNLEATLAGGGLVGNNLAAQLDGARTDAIYAEMLFLFLGLPGVIIAALLAGVIASSGRERRRREQALLRIRGAAPKRIVRLAWAEAILVAIVGTLVGLSAAAAVGGIAFGTSSFGATTGQALAWGVGVRRVRAGAVRDHHRGARVARRAHAQRARCPRDRLGRTRPTTAVGSRVPRRDLPGPRRTDLLASREEWLPGGARAGGSPDDLGELLHLARAAAVLDRSRAADVADQHGTASVGPRVAEDRHASAGPPARRCRRRLDVAPASRLVPRTRADGTDGIVRHLGRDLQHDLRVAVPCGRATLQRRRRDGRDHRGHRASGWTRRRRCEAAGRCRRRSRCNTGSPTSATICRTCTGSIRQRSDRRPRCRTRSSRTGTRLGRCRRSDPRRTVCSSPKRRCTTSSFSRATR